MLCGTFKMKFLFLALYNKFHEYSWQFEWRLALKQKNKKGVLELRIGNLSDIVHVVDTESLVNEAIKLQKNGCMKCTTCPFYRGKINGAIRRAALNYGDIILNC